MNKNKVFVCGDTHGSYDINKLNSSNFPEQKELTKDDVLIQLGDFGNYWTQPQTKEELYWLNWLAAKKFTFAFIDGNHDNHNLIWALPQEEKWGGKVHVDHRAQGDIFYLKRGEIYTINQKKILAVGGALSVDRHLRTEHIDYWSTEMLSKADENNTLDNLDKNNWKVDYVLTHTLPDSIIYPFLDNPNSEKFRDPVSRFLEFIDNRLEYQEWHCGHFHNSRTWEQNGDVYKCHYNNPPQELK